MRGPQVGSLQLCGLNATVSIVFIVDSPNRVCMDWIKQTNVLKRRKIWLSDQIRSDRVAVMAVVASRHAIQDQLLCLALQCGLDCVRAMQAPAILDGHTPQN